MLASRGVLRCAAILLAGLLPGLSVAQVPAGSRSQGWTFRWTASASADGRAGPSGDMVMDVAVWQRNVRVTVRSGPLRPMTGDGGFILLRQGDTLVSVINPARREVLVVGAGDLGGMGGGAMMGGMTLEISGVTSTVRRLGAGAVVDRYPTQRVRLTQGYTLTLAGPTGRRAVQTTQSNTIDLSLAIDRLDSGFRRFSDIFSRSLGVPAQVRQQLRALERGRLAGFPAQMTTASLTVIGGDTLRATTRAEISALTRASIDTMMFAWPADYRVTEMTRLMQQQRRRP